MTTKTRLVGLLIAGLMAAPMTKATVIIYSFTAAGGHSGSFSYDDTNTTVEKRAPAFFAPYTSYYDAISVTIDGEALPSPVIGIYNDFTTVVGAFDWVAVASLVSTTYVALWASLPTLFSSEALSELDNHQLSDFTFTERNALFIDYDGFPILTLTSAVPEPASLALLGIGLSGLGFSRRKR